MTEHRFVRIALALTLSVALAGCSPSPSSSSGMDGAAQRDAARPAIAAVGDAEASASVVPTSMLSDAVAARYGVTREPGLVLVLVGLRVGDEAQRATVSGQARDLRGVAQSLEFREVQADGLIDYVSTARIRPPDTLRFDIGVVTGDQERAQLKFSRDILP